ncbi:methionine ABC transporter ATP-binding protein [Laceyella sacchari]|jgi:D-methionine transport system ATP-binding protein|uniref:ATP-binding cassette domain-containing protein n=1 Tax=Laceyella sacchari TaxID=37482 RepID=A0ABY5U1J1_LACSH|nr:ATP-binding cassette domain-containing protein [Laceyella sacchari]TCW39217.1 D-methionine transport system ATP-binding protein [Laceyella sacchari]UWE03524.1 ATP-binding cassette domain-containing protein [Laceyella sacchari]
MIQIKEVIKTYPARDGGSVVTALDGVTLTINRGDIFGIVGYSGAGKSTLLRLINGLEMPTKGEVIVDGKEISRLKERELRQARQKIGMIFQHFHLLWSRTVRENVAFPLEVAGLPKEQIRKRVDQLLERVGLAERADAYPSQLSGGQKQRVGIARALANEPDILLCDEATSALDPETTASILQLLKEIHREMGITLVLITHEMSVVRQICNKMAVMENGRVVETGMVSSIFSQPQQALTKQFVKELQPSIQDDDTSGEVVELPLADADKLVTLAKKHGIRFSVVSGAIAGEQDDRLRVRVDGTEEQVLAVRQVLNGGERAC